MTDWQNTSTCYRSCYVHPPSPYSRKITSDNFLNMPTQHAVLVPRVGCSAFHHVEHLQSMKGAFQSLPCNKCNSLCAAVVPFPLGLLFSNFKKTAKPTAMVCNIICNASRGTASRLYHGELSPPLPCFCKKAANQNRVTVHQINDTNKEGGGPNKSRSATIRRGSVCIDE
jgi:hypothetical protein